MFLQRLCTVTLAHFLRQYPLFGWVPDIDQQRMLQQYAQNHGLDPRQTSVRRDGEAPVDFLVVEEIVAGVRQDISLRTLAVAPRLVLDAAQCACGQPGLPVLTVPTAFGMTPGLDTVGRSTRSWRGRLEFIPTITTDEGGP